MDVRLSLRHVFRGHAAGVYALEEGFNDHSFFSGSSDRYVAGWNVASLDQSGFTALFPSPVYSLLHLSVSGRLLGGTGMGQIHVLNTQARTEERVIQAHEGSVFALALNAAKSEVWSGGGDGWLNCFDIHTWELKHRYFFGQAKVRGIVLDPACQKIAVTVGTGYCHVLDVHGHELWRVEANGLSCNAALWSDDGGTLITGGRDARLRWFELGREKPLLELDAHRYSVYSLKLHPSGDWFASSSRDASIKCWSMADGQFLGRVTRLEGDGHSHSVNHLLWLDAATLLSASDDRTIKLWDCLFD
jgi:WD repeat-containing protein 61